MTVAMKQRLRTWKRSVGVIVALALTAGSVTLVAAPAAAADQYDVMRQNWYDYLIGGDYDPADPDVAAKIASTASVAQGFWDSLDTSSTRTYLWSDFPGASPNQNITDSYGRLRVMSVAYKTPGSPLTGDPTLLSDIISGLDWLNANWYNASMTVPVGPQTATINWFPFELGVPMQLNNIAVLLYDELSPTQLSNYMGAINNFIAPDCSSIFSSVVIGTGALFPATGANLAWSCSVQILTNVLLKNGTKIADAVTRIEPLFNNVLGGDGFLKDGSFLQHGKHPYNGGYGAGLLSSLAGILYVLSGSPWAYANPNITNMYQWIYDSFQPMIFRGSMMDMVEGRNISRKSQLPNPVTGIFDMDHQNTQVYLDTLALMAKFAPTTDAKNYEGMIKGVIVSDSYSPALQQVSLFALATIKRILPDPAVTPIDDLTLHRTYGSMDRVVHQRPDYAVGLSMYSNRIYNYESINGENLKGWFTGYGMTYLYTAQDLGQYSDYFWPTVDPYRLPGTTVDMTPRADASNQSQNDGANWVGGVTLDSLYGAAGMDLRDVATPLTAKKSWFMFDDEIVALGAGITDTSTSDVETTVDNRKIQGGEALTVNGVPKSTALGWNETMSNVTSIHLDGQDIGYYFPGGATVDGLRETRTGAYSDITAPNFHNTTPESRNYLTLGLDHGVAPTNGKYAYTVLPGTTSAQVTDYANDPSSIVLRNDTTAQAVQQKTLGIVGANFWTDTNATVAVSDDPNYLSSNKKASVMLKDTGSALEASVADPTQANTGTITITIDSPSAGVVQQPENVTVNQLYPKTVFTVNVNGAAGASTAVVFAKPVTIRATADAFTYASSPTTNFGTDGLLAVKQLAAGSTSNRNSYLKFDLTGLTGSYDAKLRVYGRDTTSSAGRTVTAYNTGSDAWTESGITWNNQPPTFGSAVGTGTVDGTSKYVDIDVTAYIQSQLTGDKVASLVLRDDANTGDFIQFNSRDNVSFRPQLLLSPKQTAISPVADAFTHQNAAAANYGTNAVIAVKGQTSGPDNRYSFLKFDLSGIPSASNAKIRVYGSNQTNSSPVTLSAFNTATDAWTEGGITWNNQPAASGGAVGSGVVTGTAQFVDIDVTAYVQSQISGDKIASLVLKDAANSVNFVSLASAESTTHPVQLIITQ